MKLQKELQEARDEEKRLQLQRELEERRRKEEELRYAIKLNMIYRKRYILGVFFVFFVAYQVHSGYELSKYFKLCNSLNLIF